MSQLTDFGFGTQIRKSPYFDATVRWGAQGFSVYNHMYIPRDFGDPEQNFLEPWSTMPFCVMSLWNARLKSRDQTRQNLFKC
jgi:aminomethyltransferase